MVFDFIYVILGVGWAGHVFIEELQAEAVVDALQQDAAQFNVAFDNQDVVRPVFLSRAGGRQAPRAAADDDHIIVVFHIRSSTTM